MSRKCISIGIIFLITSFPKVSWAQIGTFNQERALLRHMAKEGLFDERLFLLDNLSDTLHNISFQLEKAWTLHAVGKRELALRLYSRIPFDSIASQAFDYNYLCLLFKMHEFEKLKALVSFSSLSSSKKNKLDISLFLMMPPHSVNELAMISEYQDITGAYRNYLKASKKSPLLAATYSMIIPGLGKAYAGKKRQALNMFLLNAVLGVQAYESYRKAGFTSPRFIIFGSLLSLFYTSNIVGSVISVNKHKRDTRYQLHYEIDQRFFKDAAAYPYSN